MSQKAAKRGDENKVERSPLVGDKQETVRTQGSQSLAQESQNRKDKMFNDNSGKDCLVSGLFYGKGLLETTEKPDLTSYY